MGITVQHQPPMTSIGGAAQASGEGYNRQRQQELYLQEQARRQNMALQLEMQRRSQLQQQQAMLFDAQQRQQVLQQQQAWQQQQGDVDWERQQQFQANQFGQQQAMQGAGFEQRDKEFLRDKDADLWALENGADGRLEAIREIDPDIAAGLDDQRQRIYSDPSYTPEQRAQIWGQVIGNTPIPKPKSEFPDGKPAGFRMEPLPDGAPPLPDGSTGLPVWRDISGNDTPLVNPYKEWYDAKQTEAIKKEEDTAKREAARKAEEDAYQAKINAYDKAVRARADALIKETDEVSDLDAKDPKGKPIPGATKTVRPYPTWDAAMAEARKRSGPPPQPPQQPPMRAEGEPMPPYPNAAGPAGGLPSAMPPEPAQGGPPTQQAPAPQLGNESALLRQYRNGSPDEKTTAKQELIKSGAAEEWDIYISKDGTRAVAYDKIGSPGLKLTIKDGKYEEIVGDATDKSEAERYVGEGWKVTSELDVKILADTIYPHMYDQQDSSPIEAEIGGTGNPKDYRLSEDGTQIHNGEKWVPVPEKYRKPQ